MNTEERQQYDLETQHKLKILSSSCSGNSPLIRENLYISQEPAAVFSEGCTRGRVEFRYSIDIVGQYGCPTGPRRILSKDFGDSLCLFFHI